MKKREGVLSYYCAKASSKVDDESPGDDDEKNSRRHKILSLRLFCCG